MRMHRSGRFGTPIAMLALVAALLAVQGAPAVAGTTAPHRVLVPIGGDYSTRSIQSFLSTAAARASGPTLDVIVVPAAYGHGPSVHSNLALALGRRQQVEDACVTVLPRFPALTGCAVTLMKTFRRHAAFHRANIARFDDLSLDAAYFLGGIQRLAMHNLGGTPLEQAMGRAYDRGVVFGGTSAGDAVLSHTMIESFAHGYGADTELQRAAVLIDWSDSSDPTHRGLAFGSERAIFDEHYYQRGRFGRLINIVAQSGDHFGGAGLVGVGVDFRTVATVVDDQKVSTFGKTSATVLDFGTAGATHTWVGPDQTLSARDVLTHLIAPGNQVRYDLASRTAWADGAPVPFVSPGPWPAGLLAAPGSGALILGGDVTGDFTGDAMGAFVSRAKASGGDRVVAVFAGYPGLGKARKDAALYRDGLAAAGWTGDVQTVLYGHEPLPVLDRAAGVLLVGGDQSQLGTPLSDPRFTTFVQDAVAGAPAVMTDGGMTAAAGARYVANPDPTGLTRGDEGMADFRAGHNDVRKGLGLVPGANFEPALTRDYRWGRLYGLARADQRRIVFGICQGTALVLDATGPMVAGDRSIVSLDARTAMFLNGSNGAMSALNVVMDLFAPGDAVDG